MKPRLLDLFCGAGGCSEGYHRAGFEVVGVDIEPQPNYPFPFYRHDALKVLENLARDGHALGRYFDGIHASPPCQHASALSWHSQNRHIEYPRLIEPTRDLLQAIGLPYVIKNVVGAAMVEPVTICGASMALDLKRHRLFECSFDVMVPPCACGSRPKQFEVFHHGRQIKTAAIPVYGTGGGKAAEHWGAAMDIDWMTRPEMAQAIPPAYTEHIGHYLMAEVRARQAA